LKNQCTEVWTLDGELSIEELEENEQEMEFWD